MLPEWLGLGVWVRMDKRGQVMNEAGERPKYRVESGFGLFSVWVYSDRAVVTHVSEEQARAIAKELNAEHVSGKRGFDLYLLRGKSC